jgi:hypothetical protein
MHHGFMIGAFCGLADAFTGTFAPAASSAPSCSAAEPELLAGSVDPIVTI